MKQACSDCCYTAFTPTVVGLIDYKFQVSLRLLLLHLHGSS